MTGMSMGPKNDALHVVDEPTRLNHLASVVDAIKDPATPVTTISDLLFKGGIVISTFDTYRALEVTILSDRELGSKLEIVNTIGRYTAKIAQPLNEGVTQSQLPTVAQYHGLLKMCGLIEDGLARVRTFDEGEAREHGLAGLQDQVRWGYQQRGIPVEDRSTYTEIVVPGRDFLDPVRPTR